MAYKLFPHSKDGKNQFRITFDTMQEKSAFETAIRRLNEMASNFEDLMTHNRGILTCETLKVLDGCDFSDQRTTKAYGSGFCYTCGGDAYKSEFTDLMYEVLRDNRTVVEKMFGYHVFNFSDTGMNWFVFADPIEETEVNETKDDE